MQTRLQTLMPHVHDPPAAGAGIAAVLAALGLGISAWVTRLKFRADHLCDATGCTGDAQASLLSCDEALASPWSQLLGVPISIHAAALFALALALALALVRRRGRLWPAARPMLLLTALAAVVVSAALTSYAVRHFTHLCPYCLAIAAISAMLAALAIRMAAGRRALRYMITAVRAGSQVVIDAMLWAATIFSVATVTQVLVYARAASVAECERPADMPPEPAIRHTFGRAPNELVLVFADPACARCRNEIDVLHQSLARLADGEAGGTWANAELWVYPLPLDACDTTRPAGWFVDREGRPLTSNEAQFHRACLAARAAECVALQSPGHGLAALAELYNLHDTPPPYFTLEKIERLIRYTVTADLDGAALRACIDSPETTARLDLYQRWYARWCQDRRVGRCSVPQAFVVPMTGGHPRMDQARPTDNVQKIVHILQADQP